MRALIIEDEQIAVDRLMKLIHQCDPTINIVEELDTVEDAVEWFTLNDPPDLLFLDIHLSDGSSFEIFDQIEIKCPIIFTTAYDQYAIKAFKTKSVDYLLKPIKLKDLKAALTKYHEVYNKSSFKEVASEMHLLSGLIKGLQKEYKSRFLVKLGKTITTVPIADVAYFVFEDRTVLLTTIHNKRYPVNFTLDELEGLLDSISFIRANRQFIISINAIKKIHPWFKGRLKLDLSPPQNINLVISAEKTKGFKEWLDG